MTITEEVPVQTCVNIEMCTIPKVADPQNPCKCDECESALYQPRPGGCTRTTCNALEVENGSWEGPRAWAEWYTDTVNSLKCNYGFYSTVNNASVKCIIASVNDKTVMFIGDTRARCLQNTCKDT